jgi:acyl-CoA dehydrogenase
MSERSLLADAVEGFFEDRCTPDDVAEIEAGRDPRPLWDEVEKLGLTLASVPEAAGGGGGSLLDALTVLRSAGRHAVPLPLAETSLLAGWLLGEAGLEVGAGPLTVAPVDRAEGLRLTDGTDGLLISGRARRVPWASSAATVVAVASDEEGRLFAAAVDPSSLSFARRKNLAGEPRDTIDFVDVPVRTEALARLPVDLDELYLRGALARAVMMLGALETCRDLAVTHARDRSQFGRPIASFQAVQHMLAQIARDVAVTRAAVELAASAASEDLGGAWLEIASAKIVAGRAARTVSAQAHQVHGAIGITKEYSLSAHTRRLWSWREEFGTETTWSVRIGEAARRAPGGTWGTITASRLPLETARTD